MNLYVLCQLILNGHNAIDEIVMITPFEYLQYLTLPLVDSDSRKPIIAKAELLAKSIVATTSIFFISHIP